MLNHNLQLLRSALRARKLNPTAVCQAAEAVAMDGALVAYHAAARSIEAAALAAMFGGCAMPSAADVKAIFA